MCVKQCIMRSLTVFSQVVNKSLNPQEYSHPQAIALYSFLGLAGGDIKTLDENIK